MKHSLTNDPVKIVWYQRLVLVVMGGSLLALLAIAVYLSPDPRGFGTHQRLGLPPCMFLEAFEIRCPSCGMTTSWSNLVRGNVIRSIQANSGGTLLAVIAMIAGPWAFLSGCRGSWLGGWPNEWMVVFLAFVLVTVTLIDWGFRLVVGS